MKHMLFIPQHTNVQQKK